MAENENLVRYLRNVDPSEGTAVIKGLGDRPDIPIGGVGVLTSQELNNLNSTIVFEQVDRDSEEAKAVLAQVEENRRASEQSDPNADLENTTKTDLERIAKAESVDLSGAKNNEERKEAIVAARSLEQEGSDSLPATATQGPVSPAPGGGATGAGPEGAGGAPPDTGTATGTTP